MESSNKSSAELVAALGPVQLVLLGVGCIIGAGIFVITGAAAAQYAGPAVVISFLLAALACACAGLCYAEFAAMSGESGGAYSYTRMALGPRAGWLIGWNLILEYLVAAAFVAVGWSAYFGAMLSSLGLPLPEALSNAPFAVENGQLVRTGAIVNIPAILIAGLATLCAVVGVKRSAFANMVVVFIKVAVILIVIAIGAFHVNPELWVPFVPENTGTFGQYGWSGILRAAAVVFIAYIGFDAVATTALEARKPQRDVPVGILGSLAVCTVLYVAMALVLTGVVPYPELNVPHPVAVAVERMGPGVAWIEPLVALGAVAGLTSVILVLLLAQPRVFLAMSRHGILPGVFGRVHPKYRTPHVGTYVTGLSAMVLAGLFPIGLLGEMVSIGTLLAFLCVSLSVVVMRRKAPDLPRPFRTPLVPFVPLLSAAVCLYLMAGLPLDTWWRLVIWVAVGLVIYEVRSRRLTAATA
ncbi:MAG TPA: amino acid permease [Azospirillaceae bacterium]|nr:amino acid permease [Azospirillaceae bacterium]